MPLNVSLFDCPSRTLLEALRLCHASQILPEQDPFDLIDFSSSPVHVFFSLSFSPRGVLDAILMCALYPRIGVEPVGQWPAYPAKATLFTIFKHKRVCQASQGKDG